MKKINRLLDNCLVRLGGLFSSTIRSTNHLFNYPSIKLSIYSSIRLFICLLFLTIYSTNHLPIYASFEDIGMCARPAGMGSAFVALSDDANAIFSNPAGISQLERPEFTSSYSKLYMGLDDDSNITNGVAGFVMPLSGNRKWGVLGLGWTNLTLTSWYKEDKICLSYGRTVLDKFHVGISVKRYALKYGEDVYTTLNTVFDHGNKASAISIDLGVMHRLSSQLKLGLTVKDINEPDVGLKYENVVPMTIKGGVGYSRNGNMNLGMDIVLEDSDMKLRTGVERWLFERLALRGGLGIGSRGYRNISVGVGYSDTVYQFDYAFLYPLSGIKDTYGTHRLAVTLRLGRRSAPGAKQTVSVPVVKKSKVKKRVITREGRLKAVEYCNEATEGYKQGLYAVALDKVREAEGHDPENTLMHKLVRRLSAVSLSLPAETGRNKKGRLLRLGVGAYLEGEGKLALNALRYASQLWPDDASIIDLLKSVQSEYPDIASGEKLVPGLDLVTQKLQQALELVYDGKYVSAITECNEVLQLESRNVLAMMRLGSAYFAMGKEAEAKKIWRKALKIEPRNKELLKSLRMKRRRPVTVPKKIDVMKQYKNSRKYYYWITSNGASDTDRILVLERILKKYKGKGIDLTEMRRELTKLRRPEGVEASEDTVRRYERAVAYYERIRKEGISKQTRIDYLKRLIEKYEGTGIYLTKVRNELGTLE